MLTKILQRKNFLHLLTGTKGAVRDFGKMKTYEFTSVFENICFDSEFRIWGTRRIRNQLLA